MVRGSLAEGLQARLGGPGWTVYMRVGEFVKMRGHKHDFLCLVTDVLLGAASDRVLDDPPLETERCLRQALAGAGLIQDLPAREHVQRFSVP